MKKILNLEETIALTGGVLVLSVAVALVVIAWTGPSAEAPLNNAPAPINTGGAAQTKTGDLTVGNLSLDGVGFEGNINNADLIIGANDLRLRGDATGQTRIDLGVDASEIKFYTGGMERMVVGDDGNLYVPGLTDCFLQVDDSGKVKCYTGGTIPGGNVLDTSQFLVASDSRTQPCDNYTVLVGDVEKVVRFYGYLDVAYSSAFDWAKVQFYINGVLVWSKRQSGVGSWSGTKYYHVTGGDVLKVCASDGNVPGYKSLGKIYILNAKRELITHAFSDGEILYWYDQATRGEMATPVPPGHYIGATPPLSVIVSAKDGVEVKWIID